MHKKTLRKTIFLVLSEADRSRMKPQWNLEADTFASYSHKALPAARRGPRTPWDSAFALPRSFPGGQPSSGKRPEGLGQEEEGLRKDEKKIKGAKEKCSLSFEPV